MEPAAKRGISTFRLPTPSGPQAMKEKKIRWVDPMHPCTSRTSQARPLDCGNGSRPRLRRSGRDRVSAFENLRYENARLSNEKQQLIANVTTEAVERRMLKREIHAAGRVALDPDLVLAQNEYLIALRTSGGDLASYQSSLIRASQMRLRALGMSEAQIQDLKRQRKAQMSLLVPQKGDTVWIFGSVFESDLPWVKVGTPVQVQLPGSSETYESHVESIDPMIDFMTRTGKVRLRLNNLQGELKGDMFVRLTLNAEGSEALTLPDNSILDTGSRQVVFVDKGEGKFEPRAVKLGKRGSGYTEVLSGVSQGEKVVTNANFLLDSESRLKAAISGMEGH